MSNLYHYGNMYTSLPMIMLNSSLAPPVARGPQNYSGGCPQMQHFADHTTHARMVWGRTRPLAMQPRARPTAHMEFANLPRGWGPRW